MVQANIEQAHNPVFEGVAYDRVIREESYEKAFKPLEMGTLRLEEGLHSIVLKGVDIKESEFIDFRLLVLERLD